MKKVLRSKFFVLCCIVFCAVMVAQPLYAEEDIGLVQKLWRKLFKKPLAAERTKNLNEEEVPLVEETEGLTQEELEAQKQNREELIRQREERQLIERARRAREAQQKSQPPPRLPR